MTTHEPNTPGGLGYLLCVLTGFVACATLLVVPTVLVNGVPEALVIYLPAGFLVIAVVGCPVAAAGVLAMQVLCSRVAAQGVHVAVGAVVAAGATYGYLPLLGLDDLGPVNGWIAVVVGGSAAIGRAAVIPRVSSRRRRAALKAFVGSARW